MIKIAQFGEGNFLRTFVEAYFNELNREGSEYSISIIKPRPHGSLEKFTRQNNRYHIVLRGNEDDRDVERFDEITAIDRVFSPFESPDEFYSLAREHELKIVVSNTTEAGISFNENDDIDSFETLTYPAKLTKFLYERYQAGEENLYILPVELIENNADELARCVDAYIKLWNLPEGFADWNSCNIYCNTLVDRIVSGYPIDASTETHLLELIGKRDELLSIGEPFGLWVIENKGKISELIKEGHHNIDVVLTDDIGYYKKRKVRVLNGSHTNLVPAGLTLGSETVYDCMTDARLHDFFARSLEEIIPFVSDDIAMTRRFAYDVESRFLNPYLNHRLTSIALNSISKWRARNLPSFADYYRKNGKYRRI